ncbi:MAG: hypothetical protein WC238_03315 [Parcubacteria group bacterium]|jgi:hypothetical protein
MDQKIKKIIVALVVLAVVFIGGFFAGGRSTEIDINKRIKDGEIFATTESLDKNKATNSGDCKDAIKANNDQWKQISEEHSNEVAGLKQAANEIINPYIEKDVSSTKLYTALKNKIGNEFLDKDFSDGWDESYRKEHAGDITETKKLREGIISGPIFYRDISGQKVFYAPNYFNWTIEKLNSIENTFCDGLGCNVPTIFIANKENIFWTNQRLCSGGARSTDLIPQNEFYEQYKCELLNDAIRQLNPYLM